MEKAMLDARPAEAFLRTAESRAIATSHYGRTRFPRQLIGFSIKASHSIARTPSENIDLLAPKKLTLTDSSSWLNGSNGASLWTPSGESLLLDSYEDEYGGIIINTESLPRNVNFFASALRASLSYWKLTGKKGVWLKLPLENSELVPIAVKEGFTYHHAEQSYLMLTYWIPEGTCMLPANASHSVGVGGFVINEKDEVLVVKERHCVSGDAIWKLPTGFIHESEEIFSGAVREVKEETGIEIDELEIQEAKWMPLVEFTEQPFVQGDNMFKKIIEICLARLEKHYCGLAANRVISTFDGRSSTLYYNVVEPQDFNCKGA